MHRKMAGKDPQTMAIVPRVLGSDTHPVASSDRLPNVSLLTGITALLDMLSEDDSEDPA